MYILPYRPLPPSRLSRRIFGFSKFFGCCSNPARSALKLECRVRKKERRPVSAKRKVNVALRSSSRKNSPPLD